MAQIEMFDFPPAAEMPLSPLQRLIWISERYGRMVSQRILVLELGLSKQRVSQLLAAGRFEVFDIEGEKWVTERSILEFQREEKAKGGRPKARQVHIPGRIEAA